MTNPRGTPENFKDTIRVGSEPLGKTIGIRVAASVDADLRKMGKEMTPFVRRAVESAVKPVCGIYKIQNKQNGKVYVGSSKNIKQRWTQHISALRNGKHHSIKLQRSWDKHGESEFIFSVIEEVEELYLSEVEQEFISMYEAWVNGYNCRQTVDGRDAKDFKSLGDTPMVPITVRVPKDVADKIKTIPSDRRQELLRQIIADGLRDYFADPADDPWGLS